MLKKITVKNFALIKNAELELKDGFTVITGETGSGKSILLGALKLILGDRADYSVIRDKDKKTVVEAVFSIQSMNVQAFFEKNDLDYEEETIIRREIHAKGKSRTFINDTPVHLSVLKAFTNQLIHIHSQHHTLALKDKKFQRSILDVLAENNSLLSELSLYFNEMRSLHEEVEQLKENKSKMEMELEFKQFQLEELEKLELEKHDYQEIEKAVERGEQFDEIKSSYQLISSRVNDDDNGVVSILNKLDKNISLSDSKVQLLMERLQSVKIELNDIGAMADDDLLEMSMDPEELNHDIQLLDAYNSALKKHQLQNQEELKKRFQQLNTEVTESSEVDENILKKEEQLSKKREKALASAKKISKRRKKAAATVEKEVAELLGELKLEEAKIKFELEKTELQAHGIDDMKLYFSPNKGIAPTLIEQSASGGELSRLMLVIQYLLSTKQQLPTVIFDEIDTGVSGEVAQRIGCHLKRMGETMQLLAITHLPQVASKGNDHILVHKKEIQGETNTFFQQLTDEDRVEEIAKLMSGQKVNEAALANAKNLMNE